MIFPLFHRNAHSEIIAALYGAIVAQARTPAFYRDYGVPDTPLGRLEMIMLHTLLFVWRLEGEGAPVRALGQGVFDQFCSDMDASMREMGVGDLAVPRKMRRIAEAFYGRQLAYRGALAAADDAMLMIAIDRHVFAGTSTEPTAARLAAYIRQTVRWLAQLKNEEFACAQLSFPDPGDYAS